MKKAKTKTKTPKRAPDYAQFAWNLYQSFLLKGFNTDQAFQLTTIIFPKYVQ